MSALSNLRDKLARSKRYRESFAASVAKRMLPLQIRVLRKQRDWSQAQLAKESKLTQGALSRAEDPEYGNLTVNTLVRIAAGFDCAYVGRFVPFSELGKWYSALEDESALRVASFDQDLGFIERKESGVAEHAASVPSWPGISPGALYSLSAMQAGETIPEASILLPLSLLQAHGQDIAHGVGMGGQPGDKQFVPSLMSPSGANTSVAQSSLGGPGLAGADPTAHPYFTLVAA